VRRFREAEHYFGIRQANPSRASNSVDLFPPRFGRSPAGPSLNDAGTATSEAVVCMAEQYGNGNLSCVGNIMLLLHTHTATFTFGRHEAMAAAATPVINAQSDHSRLLTTPAKTPGSKAWHYDTLCTRGGHKLPTTGSLP
jgi:hypothetical protein